MAIKTIQNTKINTVDFIFANPEAVTYPVPPLISANFFADPENEGVKTLKVRATLYINAADDRAPIVQPLPQIIDNSLQLHFDYYFTEETPESCDVWYVELNYTSSEIDEITSVTAYLKDIDPITSRGTQTTVGQ
ncbi:MAG: hypothetical protein ABI554_06950 [Flavobacterium sp.]